MLKKVLVSLGTLTLATLLVGSTVLFGGDTATRASTTPTIALVNEDEAAAFNGDDYLFGTEFVSLVSNDNQYNWEVVSRAVAENAYSDKSVNAVVVLPRSFTRDILTFQDINPAKATIDYKVVDDDDLSHQRLQNEVFTILRDFNIRVVKMYFASIAGNISGAQVNLNTVVASESAVVSQLSDSLYPDLETTGKSYGSSVSLTGILQSLNSAWISAQNSFTESTTGTLTSVSESLGAQQPNLTDYFTLQEQIARTNVSNGNAALTDQGTSDKGFYDQAFSDHVDVLATGDGTWAGFNGFSSTDANGNRTGVLAALIDKVADYDKLAVDYNATAERMSGVLRGQRDTVTNAMHELEALETSLLYEYFTIDDASIDDGHYEIDAATLTPDLAREALAGKVATSFLDDSSTKAAVQTYKTRIENLVGAIPTDAAQYAGLLDALKAKANFDVDSFLERLDLIRTYGHAMGIPSPNLNLVYPGAETAQTVTKNLPVTVPAGARYRVGVALPDSLSLADVTVDVAAPAPTCPASTPDCVALDRTAKAATIDNSGGSGPLTVVLAYVIDLGAFTGTATIGYTAQDSASGPDVAPENLGIDVYLLAPADSTKEKIGGDDFVAITSHLGNVQTAADLLLFLYGDPGDDLETFMATVSDDFVDHSTESVVNRYGTIDPSTIAGRLSDADVDAYRSLGQENIAAIVAQIRTAEEQLHSIDANIASLSGLNLSDTYFSSAVADLENWYARAMASVSAAPALWKAKSNTVIQLDTIPWDGQEAGKTELYLDERTGPALYQSLSQLVAATSQSAAGVAAGAQLITDNTAQFDTLIQGVTKTQADAQAVLDAMKGTIATGTGDVSVSSEYSKRFATVLANTRATGADPAAIYESFANPVTTADRTPVRESPVAGWFDVRLLTVFAAGSLIGALACWLVARRRKNAPSKVTS